MKFKNIYNTTLLLLALLFGFTVISMSLNIVVIKTICVLFIIKLILELLD